jgi:hypothetical protein
VAWRPSCHRLAEHPRRAGARCGDIPAQSGERIGPLQQVLGSLGAMLGGVAGGDLTTLDGGEAEEGVTLGPFGIEVMKITGCGATDAGRRPA